MNIVVLVSTAIGFLAFFLILSVIALICAKPGRKWVWILYGIGAGLTAFSLFGSISRGTTDTVLLLTEIILFVVGLILFGLLISNKLSREEKAGNQPPAAAASKAAAVPNNGAAAKQAAPVNAAAAEVKAAGDVLAKQQEHYDTLVKEKDPDEPVSQNELIGIFSSYFAPNTAFYLPGTPNAGAYFNCVNAAKVELLQNSTLLTAATRWSAEQYRELVQNPPPGIGNMMICGLIFKMGEFAVVKDMVYCVDFAEAVPHCIALYLLLIAQKQPEDQRTQILDAGTGTNRKPLTDAIDALRPLDPKWDPKVW